jgi:hypothetical protein
LIYEFKNIKIYDEHDTLSLEQDTICFHGEILDDRGEKASKINSNNEYMKFKYDDEEFSIFINGVEYSISDYETVFQSIDKNTVVIESTTLNIVDILFILKGIKSNPSIVNVQILYIEPEEYNFKNNSLLEYDDFELSSKLKKFPPVPGFTIIARPQDELNNFEETTQLIAFLGFERTRLGQIFNSDDGSTYSCFTPIIPLPGFNPGWENRTINSHLKFFSPKNNFTRLEFVSANNPYQSYKILENFSKTCKKFRIAPIGTKPNAIGCAVFLLNNDTLDNEINAGILFDFPTKIQKRSSGVGKINIYTLLKK